MDSNFGANVRECDFNPAWPNQLWDQGRPDNPYKGQLFQVGGSDPRAGKGPFDEVTIPPGNAAFWGGDQGSKPAPDADGKSVNPSP